MEPLKTKGIKFLGYVKGDGSVLDGNKNPIGLIKSDGTVQNQNEVIIGYAKNVPIKSAAVYFFFLF